MQRTKLMADSHGQELINEGREGFTDSCSVDNTRPHTPSNSLAKLFLEIEPDVIVACDPANLGEAIALENHDRILLSPGEFYSRA
jgi:hypothetical protein